MNSNEFEILQKKLDAITAGIAKNHQENFNWANAIFQNQMRLTQIVENAQKFDLTDPYHNRNRKISPACPEIFNKYGERMEIFFMSDRTGAHVPNGTNSRYIYWDRYNSGLDTHFYTHDEIFRTYGNPKRKFAVMIESPAIVPQSYENVLQNKDYVEKNFDAIFTYDIRILSTIKNAVFAPLSGDVWYGKNLEGIMGEGAAAGFSDNGKDKQLKNLEEKYRFKTKNISIIASAKKLCPMHLVRQKFAFKCKSLPNVDTYGKFDGGGYCPIELPFEKYRFTIAIENLVSPFYFTEKILNCFAAQTIPIYIGATEIGQFFNPNGIIQIGVEDFDGLEAILAQCTPEEYERRLPAVIDNFNRVQHFANQTRFDDIYLNYIRPKK